MRGVECGVNTKKKSERINRIKREWGFSFQSGKGEKIKSMKSGKSCLKRKMSG
jgi:hypothetical protein